MGAEWMNTKHDTVHNALLSATKKVEIPDKYTLALSPGPLPFRIHRP